MIRSILLLLLLSLLVSSCAGAAATEFPVPSEPPVEGEQPTESLVLDTSTPAASRTPEPTGTPAPTNTLALTPTNTPLPTLVLPTEGVNPPVRLVWDGVPTYPGESTPGYAFRVSYDPEAWALTTDQFGFPALGHRSIPGCVISVTSGRGLPPNMSVEHEMLQLERLNFDVSTAFENGVKKFVTFTGGDGTIITAFEVSFQEQGDACLEQAAAVLSTLKSVPVSQATPAP